MRKWIGTNRPTVILVPYIWPRFNAVAFLFVTAFMTPLLLLGCSDKEDEQVKLPHDVSLTNSVSGFAGVTGTRLLISKDGTSSVQTLFNGDVQETKAGEKINRAGIDCLASTLSHAKFENLPDKLGRKVNINPRKYVLEYGTKKSILVLDPSESLTNMPPFKSAENQKWSSLFKELATTIQRVAANKTCKLEK